ncbi:formyltetrahydrofolate deformylase [Azospirillum sp. TSH100]|uniref:formyltetrahydrofolate deformylase n=1 Tax=Azospirillum sp. TSH100 TaxID=652764 RepID=UPI000D61A082|nr:formyltetrahydrofolate deformylase [Azospirillum sp. TSH100]PWC87466.1 formyltetrahydrofolate deformylase [Azospirillum sp. TSH100]QCG89736.1 formyltetrahydrofolate deformylase [Azospirillum sp. TSH100]
MRSNQNHFYMNVSCLSRPGIISAISTHLSDRNCDIIESAQFVDHDGKHFFLRMAFDAPDAIRSDAILIEELAPIVKRFGMSLTLRDARRRPKILIMVSKFGHCLNDLLYRHSISALPVDIVGVVSNHDAFRSQVESHGIAYHHLPVSSSNKLEQERRLMEIVETNDVELVVLARYMQVLSQDLCTRMAGRIINIHHSFLPSFKGAKPYHQAYKRGVKLIGATAHYVTDDLDEGPIIEQEVARVDHSMSPDDLVAIGRDVESVVLARAIRLHIEARVMLHDHRAIVLR